MRGRQLLWPRPSGAADVLPHSKAHLVQQHAPWLALVGVWAHRFPHKHDWRVGRKREFGAGVSEGCWEGSTVAVVLVAAAVQPGRLRWRDHPHQALTRVLVLVLISGERAPRQLEARAAAHHLIQDGRVLVPVRADARARGQHFGEVVRAGCAVHVALGGVRVQLAQRCVWWELRPCCERAACIRPPALLVATRGGGGVDFPPPRQCGVNLSATRAPVPASSAHDRIKAYDACESARVCSVGTGSVWVGARSAGRARARARVARRGAGRRGGAARLLRARWCVAAEL